MYTTTYKTATKHLWIQSKVVLNAREEVLLSFTEQKGPSIENLLLARFYTIDFEPGMEFKEIL